MKTQRKLHKKRAIIFICISGFLLLMALIASYNVYINSRSKSTTSSHGLSAPINLQVNKLNGVDASVNQQNVTTNTKTTNDMSSSGAAPSNSSSSIGIVISALGQDVQGGPLVIRIILDNVTGGTCTYSLSNGGTTKTYSSSVEFSGTYYSCAYNVPFTDLSAGSWATNISVKQNNASGSINKSVTVK